MEGGSIATALRESVQAIVALSPDRVSQDGAEVFDPFRRAVNQASRGREAPPAQLLEPLPSKATVLKFLLAFHTSKKMYRRQVVAVMTVLMHEKLWLQTLLDMEGLPANLPEDLLTIVEEEQKSREDEEEEEVALAEAEAATVDSSAAPAEAPAARRSSRLGRSVQQLAAARAALQELGFSAIDTDKAGDAFTIFNRAVLWIVQSPEKEDDEVLSRMEEKENVLEFLADFHDRKPKHRARITQLCVRLLEYETWREALSSCEPSVAAPLRALTGVSDLGKCAATAVNLETAAELAASRGCIGALYLRILSAKSLVKEAAPFVRVKLGTRSERTETAEGAQPNWNATPFVFEVPNPDAEVLLEIWSSDVTGDELMSSATFKILEMAAKWPQKPKVVSCPLNTGGTIDFEILFRAPENSGGYAQRGTQTVLAGLTAALWDLDVAKVEDGRTGWIVSGQSARGVTGLVCPAGHPIDKRKEGMSWRQSLLKGDTKLCNLCGASIQRTETRWRCFHHCDFNVCEECFSAKRSA